MAPIAYANGEKLIRIVKQHWIKYLFPIFIYLVLSAVSVLLFILAGITAHHFMWLSHLSFVAALVLFLFTHHWFFLMLLCESSSHIIITSQRVVWVHDRLLLDEHLQEFSFDKMKIVEASKQGLVQTLLRYGNITFDDIASIRLVPHPNRAAKDIEQAMGMR